MGLKFKNLILVTLPYLVACGSGNYSDKENLEVGGTDTIVAAQQDTSTFDIGNFQHLVDTYEDPERSVWQNPELVVNKLKPLKNKIVADIGAGTGYFTFRLAKQGADVIAIDIDERFLNYIDERRAELQDTVGNHIETRLSKENDPLLGKGEVDAILMVNTYFFLANRVDYLKKVLTALKPEGQLVIVDFKEGKMPVGPQDSNKITESDAIEELKTAGFNHVDLDESSLQYQYIITANKN